ncbi:MAG: hypothetical protein M1832_005504 [Thelocarpon impressellum]|nr:MAG: hypothetical protein M1832_005504 [Thelocarpon impressellum]
MDVHLDDGPTELEEYEFVKARNAGKTNKRTLTLDDKTELLIAKREMETAKNRNATPSSNPVDDSDSLFIPDGIDIHKRRKSVRENQSRQDAFVVDEEDQEVEDDLLTKKRKRSNLPSKKDESSDAGRATSGMEEEGPVNFEKDLEQNLRKALSTDAPAEPPRKKTRKGGTVPRAKDAREVHARRREREINQAAIKASKVTGKVTGKVKVKSNKDPKTGKANASKKGGAHASSKARRAPSKAERGGKGKTPTQSRAESKISAKGGRVMRRGTGDTADLLISLLSNNTIQDRIDQGDLGDAPVIKEKRVKSKMLDELMDSVPKEADKRMPPWSEIRREHQKWMEEINTHVKKGFFKKVMHYKAIHETSMENLADQDIIGL